MKTLHVLSFELFETAELPENPITYDTLIAQLVEHEIGNLRVGSSSAALETGRNGPPVHPAVK